MSSNAISQQVKYRQLGKSGLQVSVPILGAMTFGSSKWNSWVLDEDKALPILKAAWDCGINTIDTANMYSNGSSEHVIARFIEEYGIPRGKLIIATKCGGLVAEDVAIKTHLDPSLINTRDFVNQGGLSRAAIFNEVDASLQRLKTTYIDLLQVHRFDPKVPVEETMKALHDLVQSGKVRYLGASSMRCWQFAMMNETADKYGWTKFVSMQDEYSLLYREDEREMHAYCNHHGIGIIPWAPLATGDLCRPLGTETTRTSVAKGTPFQKVLSEPDKVIVSRVEELGQKKGCTMAQIALAWINGKITAPIVGVNSLDRLQDVIGQGVELNAEESAYLEQPYVPKAIRGHA